MVEPQPESVLSRIRTGDYLESVEFPPLSWSVHGLIPEGMGLFTGPPKAGKSWAALGIALAVSTGTDALGKIPTGDPRPVLLLALEDGERRLKGRCRHLLGEGVQIPHNLHYLTRATPAEIIPVMRDWLAMHGDRNPLVVLDTLGKVMPPTLPGEGAYNRDYRIGSVLKALVDAHPGSTLLVVHHIRKAVGEDWMDSTSGTNGLNGAADFTLNLSRNRNEDSGVLRVTGRDVPENEYAVTNRNGRWEIDGTELADAAHKAMEARATAGLGDRSADVLRFVNDHPEGVRGSDVAAEFDLSPADAGKYLARLYEAERVSKPSRGLYTTVQSVQSVQSGGINTSDRLDGLDTPTPEDPSPSTPELDTLDGLDTPTGGDTGAPPPRTRCLPTTCPNTNCQTFGECAGVA